MFRNYLLLLLLTIGFITLPGCSLFSSDNEEGDETATEEVSEDGGEVVESEESSSESSDDVISDESSSSSGTEELAMNTDEEEVVDEYPDDDYGGESASTTASSDLPDQPMESSSSSGEETLYVAGDDSATTDDSSSSASSASTDTIVDSSSMGSAGFVPVKKMKRTPYNAGGVLLNRLYIARSGDTMTSVAEKIYGDASRKRDLANWNSSLAGRSLKVGDKVYYNSARNPADSSQILLYYEEAGIAPQYYTAKSGDSIRKVSQQLLGHPRSWMEIWATNEVESKWQIQEGTSLRYWPDGTTAAPVQQTQAANEAPAAAPMEEPMDAPPADGGQNMASNMDEGAAPAPTEDMPPGDEMPPGDDMGAGAQVAQNEEPPPPQDMAPPPPPPSDAVAPPDAPTEEGGIAGLMNGQDDTTMIVVLGGLLLIAAFILLIFLKRGRKKVNYS